MKELMIIILILGISCRSTVTAFSIVCTSRNNLNSNRLVAWRRWNDLSIQQQSTQLFAEADSNNNNNVIRGDKIRDATGIRPSLHPVTINAISEALKRRATGSNSQQQPEENGNEQTPLQLALWASEIAADAIQKRQVSSNTDGMKLTAAEEQTVAGRVVGVIMRLTELESMLYEKCSNVAWIAKYNEWDSFGIIPPTTTNDGEISPSTAVNDKIRNEPLFCLNRAECFLALFLHTVEIPQLQQKNVTVPDNSIIDFLDSDRRDVLIGTKC